MFCAPETFTITSSACAGEAASAAVHGTAQTMSNGRNIVISPQLTVSTIDAIS
jgi:hypothetical protein